MTNEYNIGVGIVTHNRPESLQKLLDSLPQDQIKSLVVVNDGQQNETLTKHQNLVVDTNIGEGVGVAKNKALSILLESDVDHIFLIEDDVYIKDSTAFVKYIETAKTANYHHMNYSQHGLLNKDENHTPTPKLSINFGNDTIVQYYTNCVGAFSYYTRHYLNEVGLMNTDYFNAIEHISHTYQGSIKKLTSPFWFFADIDKSEDYIGEYETWSPSQSQIFSNYDANQSFVDGLKVFKEEHGIDLLEIPQLDNKEASKQIKDIFLNK